MNYKDPEFEASLDCIATPFLRKRKKEGKGRSG